MTGSYSRCENHTGRRSFKLRHAPWRKRRKKKINKEGQDLAGGTKITWEEQAKGCDGLPILGPEREQH